MKKTYMTPVMQTVTVAATEMICISVLGETTKTSGNLADERFMPVIMEEEAANAEEDLW